LHCCCALIRRMPLHNHPQLTDVFEGCVLHGLPKPCLRRVVALLEHL
jgi:hypothetical protein